jgi:hypothetical protein
MLQFRSIYANAAGPIAYDSPLFHLPARKGAKFTPRRAATGNWGLVLETKGGGPLAPDFLDVLEKERANGRVGDHVFHRAPELGQPRGPSLRSASTLTGMGCAVSKAIPDCQRTSALGGRAGNEGAKSFQAAPEGTEGA